MSGSKRKAEEEADGGSSLPSLFDDQTKAESTLNDIKTETPTSASTHHDVPLLSAPIPSKRFRRNPLRKGTLLPIEQIPPYPLPPLPIIDNPALLKQVFTHQSLFKHVKGKFEDTEDDLPKHYEKLEHVGDSLLGMVVTTWLHEIKPGLTPGTATVSYLFHNPCVEADISNLKLIWYLMLPFHISPGCTAYPNV